MGDPVAFSIGASCQRGVRVHLQLGPAVEGGLASLAVNLQLGPAAKRFRSSEERPPPPSRNAMKAPGVCGGVVRGGENSCLTLGDPTKGFRGFGNLLPGFMMKQ